MTFPFDPANAPLLRRLVLSDFRNYPALRWDLPARVCVLTGPNGSGKTNLLEAVSLLVPGRGLRGARTGELARHGAAHWAVAARFGGGSPDAPDDPDGFELGTGTTPDTAPGRRAFRLDGQAVRRRGGVAEKLSAVWLTPQMDRLFTEGASSRRRFLDRLVLALEPEHAREVAAHDEAMQGRNRLLATGRAQGAWIDGLELSMARHAVAAAASRRGLLAALNAEAEAAMGGNGFPAARLAMSCPVAERLGGMSALEVEDWLRATLRENRPGDGRTGGAAIGAHRADLILSDLATGRPAAQASTGQQKALLIGVVLAHAALIGRARGDAPVLLLDEPLVHLDAGRREALFAAIGTLRSTVLLTGTDPDPFAPLLRDEAGHAGVEHGRVETLRAGSGGCVAGPAVPEHLYSA
ncbi:MAG: DNA replication/repair protein RecF [Gluconacetobacter diazotrophicus]|nr:DNA replication/repair protein RecF [Gluconacetobacter diazotrophicus]